MKKSVTLHVKDRDYTLEFTVKTLAQLERSLGGRSLTFMLELVNTNPVYASNFNIDFVKNALECGIKEKDKGFDGYDFIDAYCEKGDLSDLTAKVMEALLITGLFTKGTPASVQKHLAQIKKVIR